jgi:hypothetical protein
MTACDFQQALFQELRERAVHPRGLVNELCRVIYKSKPTIYKKMQGHIGLTVDELIAISHHYHIDIDPILSESPSFNSVMLNQNKGGHDKIHEGLLVQLMEWSKEADSEILVDVAGPFIHSFHSPELIAFSLFNRKVTHGPDEYFSLQEARDDSTLLSVAARVVSEYKSLARVEFWRPHVFDLVLAQIINCLRTGRFSQPQDAMELCTMVSACAERLRNQYVSRMHQNGSRRRICLLNWGTSSNTICVRSNRVHYLYQGLWYRDWTLTHNSDVSKRAFERLKLLQIQENEDSGNLRERGDWFFTLIKNKILQTRRAIESQY